MYHHVPDFTEVVNDTQMLISKGSLTSSTMSEEDFGLAMASMYKYSSRFDGLEDNKEYTVSISTELDGKTITQVTKTVFSSGADRPPTSPKDKKDC